MGKYDLWLEEWKKAATAADDSDDLANEEQVRRAYEKGGFHAALIRDIEIKKQLAKRKYVDSGWIAYDYASLGDKDHAFEWLEKAYAENAGTLSFVKIWKAMDPLRIDPRYADLLKRMGLPQ
jgi:hypothetical protein